MKRILVCLIVGVLAYAQVFADDGLKNESEAGIVMTGGNTDTTTINLKQANTYTSGFNSYKFGANYLRSSNNGNEQAKTWALGVRYERALSDSWSVFLGQLVESNIYQNIQQRYATDIGGKYIFRDFESFKWFGEAGYRFTRENYTSGSSKNISFARLYSEALYIYSKSVTSKLWAELLPNITDADGFQFNTEASVAAAISEIFSIKTAFLLRLNNDPPGAAGKTDTTFTTALVAKF